MKEWLKKVIAGQVPSPFQSCFAMLKMAFNRCSQGFYGPNHNRMRSIYGGGRICPLCLWWVKNL